MCLADAVGNKRGVVDSLWHVALVAGKDKKMVEVDVACFKHSHELYAYGRLAMERNACGLKYLAQQSLYGYYINYKVA